MCTGFGKLFSQCLQELVVHAFLQEQTAAGRASLPGVVNNATHNGWNGLLEVDVVKDHVRRLATQFKYAFHGMQRRRLLDRSEEHTSELQSLMRLSYAVFCL